MDDKEKREEILKFMRAAGKKGGTERGKKYSHSQMSEWAKESWVRRRAKGI